jgi:2-polyprenyl-6-methoxyphenol hydroxylase-like FAD-dependent oxidoreductase
MTKRQPSFSYDVLVVGAGPSGLTTAIALARSGVRTVLVEKHPDLSTFPKATGLRPRTMEIFRGWGLEQTVLRQSQPTRLSMAIKPMLSVPGSEVSLGLPEPEELQVTSPSPIAVCPQDRLEAILLDHLLERGGEVRFSTALSELTVDNAGVVAVITSRADGRVEEIRARYIVGADGAHSAVRQILGIPYDSLGTEGHHLATLFRADLSSVVSGMPHALTAIVAPGLKGMLVPTGEGDRWIYDIEWHPEAGEMLADWPVERMAERIRAATGVPDLQPNVIGMFPWDFGAAVARRQRFGRAFLVGDAAHRTTPRGATGMNTGIADGHNLGWKLAWVVRGWAGETLLDSYEAERAGVGRVNAQTSLQTGLGAPPSHSLAQDFDVVYQSGAAVGSGRLVGRRAPHAWITVDGRSASSLDLFDGRLTVLTGPAGSGWRTPVAELALAGIPIAVLGLGRELADPTGEFVTRYGLEGAGCVLVRPDGCIGWMSGPESAPGDLTRAILAVTARVLDPVEQAA